MVSAGGKAKGEQSGDGDGEAGSKRSDDPTLADLGISRDQSVQWQKLGALLQFWRRH
jgi:hypothetical protein